MSLHMVRGLEAPKPVTPRTCTGGPSAGSVSQTCQSLQLSLTTALHSCYCTFALFHHRYSNNTQNNAA